VEALLIGFVAIWQVAIYLLLRDGAVARKHAIPLGPGLALGAVLVTLA
jgi:prepilin signal peptidase PulO-like enzyme (type II secretory pathway)